MKYHSTILLRAAVVLVIWSNVLGQIYYVSPDGSNSDPGTFDQPWQTFKYAQSRLSAGDTLYLREGTYFETTTVYMSVRGTAQAPITFQSYPGEHAVISGAEPYFMTAPNSEWVLVDPSINLYRTVRTFTDYGENLFPRAWLMNEKISIIRYGPDASGQSCMDSTNYALNGMNPFYFGPGMNQRGVYIYIRLEPNPNDLTDISGNPISPIPSEYNPNLVPMALWNHKVLISFNSSAGYLHFKDITFAHAAYIIDSWATSAYDMEFDHCNFQPGGILIRYPSYNWYIHDCDFDGGVPEWVRWLDVKAKDGENPKEAYPEFQTDCLSGSGMIGWVIERNVFRNTFDGMGLSAGSMNTVVRRNIFKYTADDAINLRKDISNCEVAYNLFWRVSSGISNLSGTGTAGPVYIHHNIIDNSHLRRGGRPNCADTRWRAYPWATLDPFGSHDSGDRNAWWRLYNNTIITRMDGPYSGATAGPTCVTGNPQKYIYNNIVYVKDSRKIFGEDLFTSGAHYDGNVMYQVGNTWSLLYNFGRSGGYYSHLADFRAANPTSDWEINGLELNPQFDFTKIDNPVYDPNIANMWERYRSPVAQIYTTGASFIGLDWPAAENISYRGALPVSGCNLDHTGLVNLNDFVLFAHKWLQEDCFPPFWCEGADLNKDGSVDFVDLNNLASSWLLSN